MGRVWALAGGLIVVCLIIYLGVGFFGDESLKFVSVLVGAGAAAAYLPGGVALSRAIYLFVGVLVGAMGFLAGAMAFPDNNTGVFFGAIVPIIVSALISMWSRRPEVFLTLMLGAGSLAAYYTEAFFLDPQGINYALPIAIGGVLAPLGLGYLFAAVIRTFLPASAPQTPPLADEALDEPIDPVPPVDETLQVGVQ